MVCSLPFSIVRPQAAARICSLPSPCYTIPAPLQVWTGISSWKYLSYLSISVPSSWVKTWLSLSVSVIYWNYMACLNTKISHVCITCNNNSKITVTVKKKDVVACQLTFNKQYNSDFSVVIKHPDQSSLYKKEFLLGLLFQGDKSIVVASSQRGDWSRKPKPYIITVNRR